MGKKNKVLYFIYFSLILFIISKTNQIYNSSESYYPEVIDVKKSGSWTLSATRISDDGFGGDYTWAEAALEAWCSGSGTLSDPYLIENATFDGGGGVYALSISDSSVYFIIRNCIFKNVDGDLGRGLFITRTENGRVEDSTASDNQGHGFYLWDYCRNITLSSNNCSNNGQYGILVSALASATYKPENITIVNNTLINNYWQGIFVNGNNNTIIGNNASDGNYIGIKTYGNNNTIIRNYVRNNDNNGIDVTGNFTYVADNILIGNGYAGINFRYDCYNNTAINNTATLNNYGLVLRERAYYNRVELNNLSNNNVYGIKLNDNCDYNTIIDNILNNNKNTGLRISFYTSNNLIINNTVCNNTYYGFSAGSKFEYNLIIGNKFDNNHVDGVNILKMARWNTFINNTMRNNTESGICFFTNDIRENDVIDNFITGNRWGVYIRQDSDTNVFFNNNISYNQVSGVSISNSLSANNEFYNNFFKNNSIYQALDNGTNNIWDNGTIGNYWQDYNGIDVNDDGFGDIPYSVNGSAGAYDNHPIWDDGDDPTPPSITINLPIINQSFRGIAPNFQVSLSGLYINQIWYGISGGSTNHTFNGVSGKINQSLWDEIANGPAVIRFYINDSLNSIAYDEVTVQKDTLIPQITVNSPNPYQLFGNKSINFNLTIFEANLNSTWYSLNGGFNYTFTGSTGTINQTAWNVCSNGTVVIIFYANDSSGNIGSNNVTIRKDTLTPSISILFPTPNLLFGNIPPTFNLNITEANLNSTWYSLNGGLNYTFTGFSGTINQTAWNVCSNGIVVIIFYANDSSGNIGNNNVAVRKDTINPFISINYPRPALKFGTVPLTYNISVSDMNLNTIWYTINGDITRYVINSTTGAIDSFVWDTVNDGQVIIKFHVNDSIGNSNFTTVNIIKDTVPPTIEVISPDINEVFGLNPPTFEILINELNFESTWYSIDNGLNVISFLGLFGSINQTIWDNAPEGVITIKFFAKDSAGNVGTESVVVIKRISSPQSISGYNVFFLIGAVFTATVIIKTIFKKKNSCSLFQNPRIS